MPEGPEIRRAADRVAKAVVDRPLADVLFSFEHLKPFEAQLTASRVVCVDTRGKAMLTRFSCGLTVYSHNQLYGRWIVGSAASPPSTRRSLRFALVGETRAARLYSASSIDVLSTDEVETDPRIAKLGPDALDPSTKASQVLARLHSKRFTNRQLAAVLLDQGFVAGLGNYLRSDILHQAGVHPMCRARDLEPAKLEALATSVLRLTRQAYRTRGVTNDEQRVAQLKSAGKTRREFRHLAYGRDRRKCYTCGTSIVRLDCSGRAVYVCPSCQPEPRK